MQTRSINAEEDIPSHEEIQRLAYEIWQLGGCRAGSDLVNWLNAEQQLKNASAQRAGGTNLMSAVLAAEPDSLSNEHGTRTARRPQDASIQSNEKVGRTRRSNARSISKSSNLP
jgi:hypothetical protein